jgi:hypothetical protein
MARIIDSAKKRRRMMKHLVISDDDIQGLKEHKPWVFAEDGQEFMVMHKDSLRFLNRVPGNNHQEDTLAKGPPFVCGLDGGCAYEHQQEKYLKLHQSKIHGVRGINWQRKHGRANGARRAK